MGLADDLEAGLGGAARRRQWAADGRDAEIGTAGELHVAGVLRVSPKRPDGPDGGKDNWIRLRIPGRKPMLRPYQVKTSRKPRNLPVEPGKLFKSCVYILVAFKDPSCEIVGWEWGASDKWLAPWDVFKTGVPHHTIPARILRPIEELLEHLVDDPVLRHDCEICGAPFSPYGVGGFPPRWRCREHREEKIDGIKRGAVGGAAASLPGDLPLEGGGRALQEGPGPSAQPAEGHRAELADLPGEARAQARAQQDPSLGRDERHDEGFPDSPAQGNAEDNS